MHNKDSSQLSLNRREQSTACEKWAPHRTVPGTSTRHTVCIVLDAPVGQVTCVQIQIGQHLRLRRLKGTSHIQLTQACRLHPDKMFTAGAVSCSIGEYSDGLTRVQEQLTQQSGILKMGSTNLDHLDSAAGGLCTKQLTKQLSNEVSSS